LVTAKSLATISRGRHPVDDIYVRRIESNSFLEACLLSPAERLAELIN
jgi:hypothetical protein